MEKRKKEKKNADLIQPGGGEEDEQRWGGGRGSAAWWMLISTGFVLLATSISIGGGVADEQPSLSLSLSLSYVKQMSWWNVLEVKKKNKRMGGGHLCGGEKQEKEKKWYEMWIDENEMKGRKFKKKKKNHNWKILPQYFYNKF